MTAQNDKQPEGGKARSGDIQARQADDGSFELVVENGAGSASSDTSASQGAEPTTPGKARPAKSPTGGTKRLGVIVVVGLVGVGALVYALSGERDAAPSDDAQVEAGFRPYLGGPGKEGASTRSADEGQPSEGQPSEDQPEEELTADDLEVTEPRLAADSEPSDEEEEEWEPEEQGEVVVIEEEHPPEESEDDEGAEDFDTKAVEKPELDTSRVPRFKERLRLPVESPKIKHLPSPQLNKLQPRLPQNRDEPAAGDEAYPDDQEQLEGDGFEGEQGESEYQDEGEGFEEYDEGY
jgi:hypothetical protein